MAPEAGLFDWLRYYAGAIVLSILVGAGGAAALYAAIPREREAATVIVAPKGSIPPRSLGSVGIVLSRSPAVYEPAADSLGLSGSGQDFLGAHSQVRPVPGSNVLLVIGREEDASLARDISSAMAQALAEAFESRTGQPVQTFDRPGATRPSTGFSLPVAITLGATVGFLAGLAGSLVHYRYRKPVLSLWRAVYMSGARDVSFVEVTRRRRFLPSRSRRKLEKVARERSVAASRVVPDPSAPDERAGSHGGSKRVIVAHAGTSERDVVDELHPGVPGTGDDVELWWVRWRPLHTRTP
jgi:hypothetical protein